MRYNLSTHQQMASLINCHLRSEDYHVESLPGRPDQFIFGELNAYDGTWRNIIFRGESELMNTFLSGYLCCAQLTNP